jgi:hypothetical protein
MSKFTEEWQATKKALGHMVGVMESMAAKYGECTEIEEVAKKKGFPRAIIWALRSRKRKYAKTVITRQRQKIVVIMLLLSICMQNFLQGKEM